MSQKYILYYNFLRIELACHRFIIWGKAPNHFKVYDGIATFNNRL